MEAVFLLGAALAATFLWQLRASKKAAAAVPRPDETLEVVLHLAAHEARVRHHAEIAPLHLLSSLVRDEEIAEALTREGVDVDALEAHFLAQLDEVEEISSREPRWSIEAQQLFIEAAAEARARGRGSIGSVQLVSRLLRRHETLLEEIERAGLSRATLLAAAADAHGAENDVHDDDRLLGPVSGGASAAVALPAPTAGAGDADDDVSVSALPDGAPVEVMLHDDDYTPVGHVVDVLCDCFDYEHQAAVDLTMMVHGSAPAPVGCYPLDQARRMRDAAVDRARAAGFPLRLTVRDVRARAS